MAATFAACAGKTVAVLGGGQLGKMLSSAAHQLGLKVIVLDPAEDCPCHGFVDKHLVGDFKHSEEVLRLVDEKPDVVTVEIEHVNTDSLEALEKRGIPVSPSSATVKIIQDKFVQKEYLKKHGIRVAEYSAVSSEADIVHAIDVFGLPLMLKARKLAYDGRGNYVIKSKEDIRSAIAKLSPSGELYVEKWVPFTKELAVMVARSTTGEIKSHPVVETTQKDNICHTVLAPAQISAAAIHSARKLAEAAINSFDGAGMYGVEMFITDNDDILVNEIAPRPHNSGHYTIEACHTSQFEQHLRAIFGLPLGDTDLKVQVAGMVNILGTGDNEYDKTMDPLNRAMAIKGASVHWYGKKAIKTARKMGHITLTSASLAALQQTIASLNLGAFINENPSLANPSPLVSIIMGSDSDLPKMKPAAETLKEFGVPFEVRIISAHRTPLQMIEFAKSAPQRGVRVIIAAAGGAAHLPGMTASLTPLPVIGVPINITALAGVDAVHSILQMPKGVPVATVAIDNSINGALLAVRILAAYDTSLFDKMEAYQNQMEKTIREKDTRLVMLGYEAYQMPK